MPDAKLAKLVSFNETELGPNLRWDGNGQRAKWTFMAAPLDWLGSDRRPLYIWPD